MSSSVVPTAIRGGQKLAAAGAADPSPVPTSGPTSPAPSPTQPTVSPTAGPTAAPAALPVALSPTALHVARRWSGGYTPALAAEIQKRGGGLAWFQAQLKPTSFSDPIGTEITSWFPSLKGSPKTIYTNNKSGKREAWRVMLDLSRWTVARQIHSTRQVQEQMVSFWSNLLNVPIFSDTGLFWRVDYDKTIRKYSLDTFEHLLKAAITHPAMGLNLNNAESTKDAPNENLGRELLELHTVGVDAGYTEDDVKASAKMLTGYRVWVYWPSFKAEYRTADHYVGPLTIMGFTHPNSKADGRVATAAYLSYLARHPATAQRIARRLCVKFVDESPSQGLIDTVAAAYLASGTAIKPTLLAMVAHPEFSATATLGAKVRMPTEDYVATVRALGTRLKKPQSDQSYVNAMYWQYDDLGQSPYEWPAPNGYPEVNAAWTSAGRVLTSFDMHKNLAGKWWPTKDATLWNAADLLPALPATLQAVIDFAGMRVLGEKPGAAISAGIATVLDMQLTDTVDAHRTQYYWFMRSLLASLLDSPIHLHR